MAKLEPLLKPPRLDPHGGGRPRKYELRRVVDALLYVGKTGCQWRQLPVNFPPWLSVHQQFRAWRGARDQPSLRMSRTVFPQMFEEIIGNGQIPLLLILHFEPILRIRPNPQDSLIEIDAGPCEINRLPLRHRLYLKLY